MEKHVRPCRRRRRRRRRPRSIAVGTICRRTKSTKLNFAPSRSRNIRNVRRAVAPGGFARRMLWSGRMRPPMAFSGTLTIVWSRPEANSLTRYLPMPRALLNKLRKEKKGPRRNDEGGILLCWYFFFFHSTAIAFTATSCPFLLLSFLLPGLLSNFIGKGNLNERCTESIFYSIIVPDVFMVYTNVMFCNPINLFKIRVISSFQFQYVNFSEKDHLLTSPS